MYKALFTPTDLSATDLSYELARHVARQTSISVLMSAELSTRNYTIRTALHALQHIIYIVPEVSVDTGWPSKHIKATITDRQTCSVQRDVMSRGRTGMFHCAVRLALWGLLTRGKVWWNDIDNSHWRRTGVFAFYSDVNKDWTCKYKDKDKDFIYSYFLQLVAW